MNCVIVITEFGKNDCGIMNQYLIPNNPKSFAVAYPEAIFELISQENYADFVG